MASQNTIMADERTPLIPEQPLVESPNTQKNDSQAASLAIVWAILPTLLLGVFIAQADSSIVLATSQEVASEFGALSDASWLITTYVLAQAACQPLYGKTSDVFGRKPVLTFAYIVFTLGCVLCGIGTQYWQVLAGRAISGIGGAGMVGLVAIVIADILPPREVAAWRSYVNVIATLGRSCGGPTGGVLVDSVGWRWCFLGQCPIAGFAILLIIWRLPDNINPSTSGQEASKLSEKVSRIDFAGFVTLPVALVAAFVALDLAGKLFPWVYIVPLAVLALVLLGLFYYIEKYRAEEPIIPMDLIGKRDVAIPYLLVALQTAAQFIITYTIPIYFQIVSGMSVTAAGSRIVLIVIGNTLGGLLTGWFIHRTGHYKILMFVATFLGNICYLLVLVRWHGTSSWLDTWYIILGGIGMGSTQNTTFVHLAASLDAKDIAIAGTTWFLSQSLGMLVAANLFNVVHNFALVKILRSALHDVPDKEKIIDGISSSVEYIHSLPHALQATVREAFMKSLIPTNAFALVCGVLAMLVGVFIRERRLESR